MPTHSADVWNLGVEIEAGGGGGGGGGGGAVPFIE